MTAYDPDGNELWTVTLDDSPWSTITMGPDGTLYVAGIRLHAIDPGGAEKWSAALTGNGHAKFLALGEDRVYAVVPYPDAATTAGWPEESLVAVDANGSVLWVTNDVASMEPAVAEDGNIHVGSYGAFNALDVDGHVLWRLDTACYEAAVGSDHFVYTTCVLEDYPDVEGMEDVRSLKFAVLDADGEVRFQADQYVAAEEGNGPPALEGGRAYFACGFFIAYIFAFDKAPDLADSPWPRARGDNQNTGRH